MAGAFLSGAGAALGGAAFNKLTGGGSAPKAQNPIGISAGGLTSSVARVNGTGPRIFKTTRSDELNNILTNYSNSFGDNAASLKELLGQVEPGIGMLTKAGTAAFENARTKLADRQRAAIGNLRDNLARRRVLGSSFASDALSRQDATYEQAANDLATQEAQFRADAYQKELSQKIDLMNQISANTAQKFKSLLDQSNLESSIATNLATGGNSVINTGQALLTDLYKSQQAGAGSFFEPYTRQIGDTISGYFNSQPTTTPTTVMT